jgi:hypothetical protein
VTEASCGWRGVDASFLRMGRIQDALI